MILDYYRIFYYVAQYKSFSKAADVMGNNQPNITRCMNILENELGCKLFIRSNRGVQLTIEGERLFEHVSIAIEQLVSGENELLKDKGLESGLVNIGKRSGRLCSSYHTCRPEKATSENSPLFFPRDPYRWRGICGNSFQQTLSS